jgi:hypothetical protein
MAVSTRAWIGEIAYGFDCGVARVRCYHAWFCAATTLTPRPPLPPAGEGGKRARVRSKVLTVLLPSTRVGEKRAVLGARFGDPRHANRARGESRVQKEQAV